MEHFLKEVILLLLIIEFELLILCVDIWREIVGERLGVVLTWHIMPGHKLLNKLE